MISSAKVLTFEMLIHRIFARSCFPFWRSGIRRGNLHVSITDASADIEPNQSGIFQSLIDPQLPGLSLICLVFFEIKLPHKILRISIVTVFSPSRRCFTPNLKASAVLPVSKPTYFIVKICSSQMLACYRKYFHIA